MWRYLLYNYILQPVTEKRLLLQLQKYMLLIIMLAPSVICIQQFPLHYFSDDQYSVKLHVQFVI